MIIVMFIVVYFSVRRETEDKKDDKVKGNGVKQIDVGKEAAIEAEVKAARERAVIPLEIRMKQFRDMLAEKEVLSQCCIVILLKKCIHSNIL
jgi:RNA binding exosome subunit